MKFLQNFLAFFSVNEYHYKYGQRAGTMIKREQLQMDRLIWGMT